MNPVTTNNPVSILIVDGDVNITSLLHDCLVAEGYNVEIFDNAEAVLCKSFENVRLIISEVNLKEINGFELLERLKDAPSTAYIPFMFCTVEDSESNLIKGLDAGADDYIIKPFSLREMVARIKSVLRRHRHVAARVPASTTLDYKTLRINLENNAVTIDGNPIMLTPTEQQILTLMFRNRNKLFSREEIHKIAWPGQTDVSPRTVDVNISRLRKKLGEYGANIVNRTGFGYGFMD